MQDLRNLVGAKVTATSIPPWEGADPITMTGRLTWAAPAPGKPGVWYVTIRESISRACNIPVVADDVKRA